MNSSIFNFENFRRYRSLPKRDKWWHVSVVCALLSVSVLSLRIPELIYGRFGCPKPTIATAAVAALSPKTEVLFIGSSHMRWGIRPERYSMEVVNLSIPGMNYACVQRVAQKHIDKVPNLKVAVMEFDEIPVIANTLKALRNDFRPLLELGLGPQDLPTNNIQMKLKAATYPMLTLPRVTPLDWEDSRTAEYPNQHPAKGFAPGYFYTEHVMSPSYSTQLSFKEYLFLARDTAMTQTNLQALHETIDLFRKRNITVVLLHIPLHRTYREKRPKVLRGRLDLLRKSINNRYGKDEKVLIWDLENMDSFVNQDFFDLQHLNVYGANKLAPILDKKLRALDITFSRR